MNHNASNISTAPSLVTGGTGLLGSHIAERLRRQGTPVRAICRPSADTSFLASIGVEIVSGDLADAESLRAACEGISVVYHAAARVGDWGPWSDFVRLSIEGTRLVAEAAATANVQRFLHVSSISAYGHVDGVSRVFDESAPLGVGLPRWGYYSRAKVEAEHIVWALHEAGRLRVTVIRPSWLYGPRDRVTLPRLIDSIKRKKLKLIGDGNNRLNVVHAGNVADACILAAQAEQACGEAYNCSHDGYMTQRKYYSTIAKAIGKPEVTATVPYIVAKNFAFVLECAGHLFRIRKPPLVTRYAVWLMGRRCFFECNKLKEQLGWSPTIPYETGILEAVHDALSRPRPGSDTITPISSAISTNKSVLANKIFSQKPSHSTQINAETLSTHD